MLCPRTRAVMISMRGRVDTTVVDRRCIFAEEPGFCSRAHLGNAVVPRRRRSAAHAPIGLAGVGARSLVDAVKAGSTFLDAGHSYLGYV